MKNMNRKIRKLHFSQKKDEDMCKKKEKGSGKSQWRSDKVHDSGTQNPKVCKLRRVVQECGRACREKVSRRTREMEKFEEDTKTKVLDA